MALEGLAWAGCKDMFTYVSVASNNVPTACCDGLRKDKNSQPHIMECDSTRCATSRMVCLT